MSISDVSNMDDTCYECDEVQIHDMATGVWSQAEGVASCKSLVDVSELPNSTW